MRKWPLFLCTICAAFLMGCGGISDEWLAEGYGKPITNEVHGTAAALQSEEAAQHQRPDRLSDMPMAEPYRQFLYGNLEVPNPYSEEAPLSFYMEELYWEEEENTFQKEGLNKYFSLLDINGDGTEELLFRIQSGSDELLMILSCAGETLTAYDIYETHTPHMAFQVYDNGVLLWSQNHTGAEEIYYRYDESGSPIELFHFVSSDEWLEKNRYSAEEGFESYYANGEEAEITALHGAQEYEKLVSDYQGNQVDWYDLNEFGDAAILRAAVR